MTTLERLFLRTLMAVVLVVLLAAANWPREVVRGLLGAGPPLPGEVVPRQLPYRGYLERNGAPVTGGVSMSFAIRNDAGVPVWQTTPQSIAVQQGIFSVELGELSAIPSGSFDGPFLELEVIVEGVSLGTQRLLSVGYAQAAGNGVPSGAVMLFDRQACPPGWSDYGAGAGRVLMGRPALGTLGRTFGAAASDDTELSHTHALGVAGAHQHPGVTGNKVGYRPSAINYGSIPEYQSPYHLVSELLVESSGEHQHPIETIDAGAVLPYVYLTSCRKN